MKSALERFTEKYVVNEETGCWEWAFSKFANGYGTFSVKGHTEYAHRFAWAAYRGFIPDGLHIDHLCRVRHCVNPDHLEPVTPAENSRRGEVGMRTHCPKGHEYAGSNLKLKREGWRDCRTCHNERERERARRKREVRRASN